MMMKAPVEAKSPLDINLVLKKTCFFRSVIEVLHYPQSLSIKAISQANVPS